MSKRSRVGVVVTYALLAAATIAAVCVIDTSCERKHGSQAAMIEQADAHSSRVYSVYLIWIRDREKWDRYRELVAPIARRYGAVERSLVPNKVYFEGHTAPDLVNVVYSDSGAQLDNLAKDPAFQRIVHLRSESVDMMSVHADAIGGAVSNAAIERRAYLLEIAQFGPEGAAGYQRYESESEPVLRRYGYHVERVLRVHERSPGFAFEPQLVKVAYFEEADGMAKMEADAEHARIEALYPLAVKASIWIFASALQ